MRRFNLRSPRPRRKADRATGAVPLLCSKALKTALSGCGRVQYDQASLTTEDDPMTRILSATLFAVFLTFASTVSAGPGDPELGKAKSAICVACHGVAGISPNPQWPNLAGQKDQYLILSMKAYRDGDRQNALMSPISQGLSDEDIENLAAYYSSLPAD